VSDIHEIDFWELAPDQGQQLELAAIANELQQTAGYAIDPAFKERLRAELMEQFKENN